MIAVTARLRARKGEEEALTRQLGDLARAVREAEPDCLLYAIARSKHDPQLFVTLERYRGDEALAAHANAPHTRDAMPELLDRLEERPEIALFDELD